jgi:hypothetical protein
VPPNSTRTPPAPGRSGRTLACGRSEEIQHLQDHRRLLFIDSDLDLLHEKPAERPQVGQHFVDSAQPIARNARRSEPTPRKPPGRRVLCRT